MVDLEPLQDSEDVEVVRDLLMQHAELTGSAVATRILREWDEMESKFVKVMPRITGKCLEEEDVGGEGLRWDRKRRE